MTAQAAEQFNNNFIVFPRAFYAKPKKDKNGKVIKTDVAFKPAHGRRYNTADGLILSAINKINSINSKYDVNVKITYELLHEKTGLCNATIWNSLTRLEKDKQIEFCGTSRYEIVPDFSARSYIIIYNFLLTEELNLGGKISKRLSKNATVLLSEVIAFYLNKKHKGEYFDGGEKSVATLLNVALGTANGIIKELIKVGAIYRNVAIEDKNGIIVKAGKSKSSKEHTIFQVNKELLLRCAKIKAEADEKRDKRYPKAQESEPEQSATTANSGDVESSQKPEKPKKNHKKHTVQKVTSTLPPRRSVTEEWASTLVKLNALQEQPPDTPPNGNN